MIIDLLCAFGYRRAKNWILSRLWRTATDLRKAERDVRHWDPHRRLPIVGGLIQKHTRTELSYVAKKRNQALVYGVRALVSSGHFEDLVNYQLRDVSVNKLRASKPMRAAAPNPNGLRPISTNVSFVS